VDFKLAVTATTGPAKPEVRRPFQRAHPHLSADNRRPEFQKRRGPRGGGGARNQKRRPR
jgi:hypothetical protein